MVRVLPVARFAEHTDDRPVVLSGPPEALTGRVSVTNPTDQRVVVRTGALTGFSAEKDNGESPHGHRHSSGHVPG
jgi:hypothetical protein